MQRSEKYQTISILEAIQNIESRKFRLPAIQRKFIWKPHQIIALFDSILQGYPINTFMMWHVKESKIKTDNSNEPGLSLLPPSLPFFPSLL